MSPSNAACEFPGYRVWVGTLLLLGVLLLGGCASGPRPPPAPLVSDAEDEACWTFFQALEQAVADEGVRDGVGAPMADYPWFRSSRFIHAAADHVADAALAAALVRRDRRARFRELRNLSAGTVHVLMQDLPWGDPETAVVACGDRLTARLIRHDADVEQVRARTAVPDEYVTWQRWAGLYPVSRYFILAGVARWQNGTREAFETGEPDRPAALRYSPVWPASVTPNSAVRSLIARAPRDAMGRLRLSENRADMVLAAYAPVIELEADRSYNRLGAPAWLVSGVPGVTIHRPTLYTSITHTRFQGETLPQLNYTIWFTSRPKRHPLDLLGGRMDGMTVRMTLDNAGSPMLLETMHNCGCYHQFYPFSGLTVREDSGYAEPPLVLPSPGVPRSGERLVLRLRDRSHYVSRIYRADADADAVQGMQYAMEDYDTLRSLRSQRGSRSLFGEDGLVAGTYRDERMVLWVSGVPSPGAMRQLGRHATAFVGRRHFDDPDLIDRVFEPASE